jgi:hypothetical protein
MAVCGGRPNRISVGMVMMLEPPISAPKVEARIDTKKIIARLEISIYNNAIFRTLYIN